MAAVLSIGLVAGSVAARAGWVNLQPHAVFDQATVESPAGLGATVLTDQLKGLSELAGLGLPRLRQASR